MGVDADSATLLAGDAVDEPALARSVEIADKPSARGELDADAPSSVVSNSRTCWGSGSCSEAFLLGTCGGVSSSSSGSGDCALSPAAVESSVLQSHSKSESQEDKRHAQAQLKSGTWTWLGNARQRTRICAGRSSARPGGLSQRQPGSSAWRY